MTAECCGGSRRVERESECPSGGAQAIITANACLVTSGIRRRVHQSTAPRRDVNHGECSTASDAVTVAAQRRRLQLLLQLGHRACCWHKWRCWADCGGGCCSSRGAVRARRMKGRACRLAHARGAARCHGVVKNSLPAAAVVTGWRGSCRRFRHAQHYTARHAACQRRQLMRHDVLLLVAHRERGSRADALRGE